MKLGLYRIDDPFLGECARVKWFAGDGAPYLPRGVYTSLQFEPRFDQLPKRTPSAHDLAQDRIAGGSPDWRTDTDHLPRIAC